MRAIIHWDHKPKLDHAHLRYMFQYWDYTCRGFGMEPSNFAFVDLEGTLALLSPPNPVFQTLAEALELFSEYEPVYIHDQGKAVLGKFDHPENAVYIVGPNYDNFSYPSDAESVRIATAWEDLWSHVALGIVLYDRSIAMELIK